MCYDTIPYHDVLSYIICIIRYYTIQGALINTSISYYMILYHTIIQCIIVSVLQYTMLNKGLLSTLFVSFVAGDFLLPRLPIAGVPARRSGRGGAAAAAAGPRKCHIGIKSPWGARPRLGTDRGQKGLLGDYEGRLGPYEAPCRQLRPLPGRPLGVTGPSIDTCLGPYMESLLLPGPQKYVK